MARSFKLFRLVFLVALLAALLACPALSSAENAATPVTGITLSESELLVPLGTQSVLTATVAPENASNKKVEWSSSDPAVATVQNGRVKGVSAGKCDILCKALDESGVQAVCHVEVVTPVKTLSLSEKQVTLLVGAADELSVAALSCTVAPEDAYWQAVTWESSNEAIVTVSADGTVKALAPGRAVVTALTTQPGSKAKAQAQVIVQQAVTGIALESESVSVPVKKSVNVKAAVSPNNASNKKLVWSSSDEAIAKVSAQGAVQGISAGEAVITATAADGSGITASCDVTVYVPVSKVTLSEPNFSVPAGLSRPLSASVSPENATNPGLVWSSSDESVATVDETGTVTGVSFGRAKITATAVDGSKASASATVVVNQPVEGITLKRTDLYVPVAGNAVLKAAVLPDNAGNKNLEWSSSDESVATVSKDGKITGVSAGEAVITAKAADGTEVEASCAVTVGADPYDEGYAAGLEYMKEEKYYSARGAFETSRMVDAEDMAANCIRPWPKTGELWHNKDLGKNDMVLQFQVGNADSSRGMYFMVYTEDNVLASTMFVHGSGKASARLPGGNYRIRDAAGTEWYGEKETFGKNGSYEYMVFNEVPGDEYLTVLDAGYAWTISVSVSEATGGTGVGSDETDWESWGAGTP